MLSMIVALDPNNLIGRGNELPWYYPEDLKYFKQVTSGKAVLMGYNTYLSIYDSLGRALPNRINYVLTSRKEIPGTGIIVRDLDELLKKHDEIFIIGGKMVYESFYDRIDRLYITRIHQEHIGDVYLKPIDMSKFTLISQTKTTNCTFEVYARLSP